MQRFALICESTKFEFQFSKNSLMAMYADKTVFTQHPGSGTRSPDRFGRRAGRRLGRRSVPVAPAVD